MFKATLIAALNDAMEELAASFITAIPGATITVNRTTDPDRASTLEGTTPDGFAFTYGRRDPGPGTETEAAFYDPESGFAYNPYTIVTRKGVDPVEYAGVSLRAALIAAGVAGAQLTADEVAVCERDKVLNELLATLSGAGGRILTMDQVMNGGLASLLADGDHDQGAR